MGNTRNTGYLQNIVLYDENDNITLPARLAVTGTVSVNNTTPYDTTQFSLDVNGGLIVKNINKTAQFVLINSNPASGGNNAFVVHTVGGTSASSYADIQGYYGTSIAGSTVLRLNPQGGNVLVGSLAGTGNRMVVASATGVLSTQAIVTLGDLSGVSTSRTITINGTTQDLSADRTFTLYTDNISEDGSPVNLWFTNARARAAVSVSGSISYDSATGVFSYTTPNTDGIVEGTLNLYYTNARFDTRFGTKTTSDLAEGTNLYYTQTRFNTAFSGKSTSDLSEGTNLYYTDTRVGSYLTSNNYATQTYVGTAISNLVDAAPGTLDTLNELAAALGDDPNFATSVATSIGTKEPIITAGTTLQYWRGDKTWQTLPIYTLSGLGGVPTTRTITINGTALDLSADRSFTINSMVYPGAGIAVSTGTAWSTSITDNSTNWNTAYGWGNHASAGYLTTSSAASTYVSLTGSYANPSWVTSLAYSKITGVPAFLTSYTETDTLASVTGRGATTTAAITTGGLTVNTGGSGTWGQFVVNSTSLWGDGATLYTTIGAGGAAGVMLFNPHVVWNSGSSCAGIRIGRSGGTSSGKYYEIGTGASDNFFIAKEGLASGTQLNINSSGNATFSGTITASNFSGSHSGTSSGTNTGDQTSVSGSAGSAGYADRIQTGNNQWVWSNGAHTATNPNTITLWDQYSSNGGAGYLTAYATIVDIYGRSGHEHDQLYFDSSGTIYHRNCFYGTNSWNGWRTMIDSSNIGSYAMAAGGSWGADLTSNGWTRQIGLAYSGGEWVVLTKDSQVSTLIDGSYFAGENGGHWSLNASNVYTSRVGFYHDGSTMNFRTNNAVMSTANIRIYPVSESWAEGLSFIMPTASTWGGLRWQRQRSGSDGNWYLGYTALDSSDDLVFGTNNGGTQTDSVIRMSKTGLVSMQQAYGGATLILGAVNLDRVYSDTARHSLVVNASYYPHIYVNATAGDTSNTTHGPVISMTGRIDGGYRRWSMGIANYNPNYFSIGWYDNNTNPHYGTGQSWSLGGRFVIDTSGNMWVTGDITAYGSQSDIRLKDVKGKVNNALEGILKLSAYRFDWKEQEVKITTFKEDIGVIAQEVIEVFPELARTGEDGWMSVRYQGLTAVLIEAVKEQQTQIESQKIEIDELKDLVKQLINR